MNKPFFNCWWLASIRRGEPAVLGSDAALCRAVELELDPDVVTYYSRKDACVEQWPASADLAIELRSAGKRFERVFIVEPDSPAISGVVDRSMLSTRQQLMAHWGRMKLLAAAYCARDDLRLEVIQTQQLGRLRVPLTLSALLADQEDPGLQLGGIGWLVAKGFAHVDLSVQLHAGSLVTRREA
ncbi:hypothetical protein [Niveibacterium sp. SC-1]|uniref:hypothetical protein n=1 Tax=Niveibacterium sp. SC-1 TaxID=3135646 RepID=UPI00311EBA4C